MGPNSSDQHIVTIIQQVMRGNSCRYTVSSCDNKRNGLLGGDVLEDDPLTGEALDQWAQVPVNKHFFTIKNINF